jgi:hypothetical protein
MDARITMATTPPTEPKIPAKGTPAWIQYAKEQYGWVADLYQSVAELQVIIDQAVREKWLTPRFLNAVQSTQWSKTKDAKERAYLDKQTTDPTTLANDINAKQFELETYIGKQGYSLDPVALKNLATQAIKYGWDTNETARYVGAEVAKTGKTPGGVAGEATTKGLDAATVRQYAIDYGIKLDDATINAYSQNLIMKTMTPEQVKEMMRRDAENLYPALKGQLDAGRTVAQATATYRATAASVLGIDPYTIDFTDANKWGRLLSYQDPNTNETRLMNGTEWGKFLRTLPEWQTTDEAKTLYRDVASTITRGFGAVKG